MREDYVAEAVFDFLENGGDLPADASKNPQSRFMFQTAIAKQTYQKSCLAIDEAGKAKSLSVATAKDMATLNTVVDTKMEALVDKVNVRLGLVGGIIIAANVALFFLVKLWPIGG
jgi:N-acyl-L-homoserine lactone synthetase